MVQVVHPSWYGLSNGSGSTACWLPVAFVFMPKVSKAVRDQIQLEKLERKMIILSSKIEVLTTAQSQTQEQIDRLKLVIASS